MLPCVIFEDEHLLVVNKPAGMNTHAPAPYAGEGIYDWLRNREARWASLAIIHRLDKETSGVMVFGKTATANRSLTEQFTQRKIRKKYLLLTDGPVKHREFVMKSKIIRAGERYVSARNGEPAETKFRIVETDSIGQTLVEAEPITGRTHQIRVHAADAGFPIIGDALYGGVPSQRICLHASQLTLQHPVSGLEQMFEVPLDFNTNSRDSLREALIEPELTNTYRMVHGASDGPQLNGWYVDRLGSFLLSASDRDSSLAGGEIGALKWWMKKFSLQGAYHKTLAREVRQKAVADASPRLVIGNAAPDRFVVRENGVRFELSFSEGYSTGLFLDQRDNRRRFRTGYVAPGFFLDLKGAKVLNTFAYTCGFSVCAALAGARVTSVDLSKKYLAWGKRNFALNNLDSSPHDFIYGDAFDWLRRLAKKERMFDAIVVDPPTFSQSKESGVFRVEKDYGKLVSAALPLIKPGGVLFASTNAAGWPPDDFLSEIEIPIKASRRKIIQRHYAPQPPDFPVSRAEPAYLKTIWMRIG